MEDIIDHSCSIASEVTDAVSEVTDAVSEGADPFSAPSSPPKITLVLKLGWRQMKDFYHGLSDNDILSAVKSERKEITQKLKSGKDINQREVEAINQSIKQNIKNRFSNFQQALYSSLELKESDNGEIKLVKIQLAKEIIQWLEQLENWLNKKLSAIFDDNKIPEDKILEETERFTKQLNNAMKPPALEELMQKMSI